MQEQPTAAEAGRDPRTEIESEEIKSPFTPTQEWIRHYHKQATAKLVSGLNQYARTRALSVADAGRKVDDYYARELVLDALGDTWLGVVHWDPDKCSLAYHVVRTIEGRADKHRKQALHRPHDALGDETEASRSAETAASECSVDEEDSRSRVHATEIMVQIRTQGVKDAPLLRILDAYDAGCTTKEQVLTFARMKSRTYHNAYGRLRRIVRNLTDHQFATRARA
jgi:hypothetical protein